MAGGKLTPRQKMINMMYLVLTAMLALNVSVEVLDAFVKIERGLQQTLEIGNEKNQQTLANFAAAAVDNKTKVEKWQQKALLVDEKTQALNSYIGDIKIEIIKKGDGENSRALDGDKIIPENIDAKENTDVSSKVMVGNNNGKAYELRGKIEEYKNFVFKDILNELEAPGLVDEINGLLNFEFKTTDATDSRTWEAFTFGGIPLMSAVALLTKMQVDVQNCESSILDYLFTQIDASSFKFTGISAIVKPISSSAVVKGSDFEAQIFLGAYDATQKFTANLNVGNFTSDNDGKITIKRRSDGIGIQHINGKINFKGPDGDMEIPVRFEYQVVEPNLVVSADKMNVFYRGIKNPVSISIAGVPMNQIEVGISNASYEKDAQGIWQVTPQSQSECVVTVTSTVNGTKQSATRKFRVKNVPPPTPAVHGISGKSVPKNELAASQGIVAKLPPDFDFELKYDIVSFTVSTNSGGYNQEETSNNYAFTEKQKGLINGTRQGDLVAFTNIKAKGPNGTIDLNDLVIKIR